MKSVVGVDIAQDTFEVVLLREEFDEQHASFENDHNGFPNLARFLKKRKAQDAHICMEATGVYYEGLAEFLAFNDYTVSVVNPARIKAYAQSQLRRNKTDRLDARIIADFCRTQNPALWTPPDPSWIELRSLARHLEDLISDRQRQDNRLHALKHAAHPSPAVVSNLEQHIALLSEQIDAVKKQIQDHIDQHPELKRQRDLITSIKGIGALTAAKLLAEYLDIRRFDDIRQVVAFAGLNPRQHRSGSSLHGQTRISKMGCAAIRAALYMPAISAKNHNALLRPFVQRLEARGVSEMQIVIAVMRKLLHLVFGIIKSGQPFDPNFLHKEAVFA